LRLDLWLKRVCLLKSRSLGKRGCQSGDILLNGEAVKESHGLRSGEILQMNFPSRRLEIEVLTIPTGNVTKKDAPDYYRVLDEELIPRDLGSGI
jgi:ribosomal 50S subunit-recycling heat shock protein